jgi:hypothetical protein
MMNSILRYCVESRSYIIFPSLLFDLLLAPKNIILAPPASPVPASYLSRPPSLDRHDGARRRPRTVPTPLARAPQLPHHVGVPGGGRDPGRHGTGCHYVCEAGGVRQQGREREREARRRERDDVPPRRRRVEGGARGGGGAAGAGGVAARRAAPHPRAPRAGVRGGGDEPPRPRRAPRHCRRVPPPARAHGRRRHARHRAAARRRAPGGHGRPAHPGKCARVVWTCMAAVFNKRYSCSIVLSRRARS